MYVQSTLPYQFTSPIKNEEFRKFITRALSSVCFVTLKVLGAVTMNNTLFRDVTPCTHIVTDVSEERTATIFRIGDYDKEPARRKQQAARSSENFGNLLSDYMTSNSRRQY
jgi:hypothetical protein